MTLSENKGVVNLKVIELVKKYNIQILIIVFLIIGTAIRLIDIGKVPNALNVDEASTGYEAYSIMKYGIDRAGNSYPVYLYAWGSGQSALYSYLMIPFVAVFGLSEFAIRLPMAIIGVISLIVFYYLIKNIFDNKKIAIVGLAIFAICPWHIMKSRWGMECNIFPDIILFATLLLVLGIKKKKNWLQILSFVILGISSYSYSTSYLFLPIFVILTLAYLIYKKELTVKKSILYLLIMFVVCIPILLYICVNSFGLDSIKIFGITIPRLASNRYEEISTVFSGNIYENCVNNLLELSRIILLQNDNLEWNAIKGFGLFYNISIIFFFIGIWNSIKKYKDNEFNQIMNIWMISSIILGAFTIANINRINIIMIPCLYYIAIGLYEIIHKYRTMLPCIVIIYVYMFVNFAIVYWHKDYNQYYTFTSGIKEVAEYCKQSNAENVYCEYSFKEPFIYFMFYTKADVHEYIETVQYFKENRNFDNIKSYGKYKFYLPDDVEEGSIVVVKNDEHLKYNQEPKEVRRVNQFDIYVY